ncbi:hypothetical protein K2173_020486 [Erythroxylum novogranatense]|uniref:Cyclin-dependent protein kinase inhibitor SMR1 n=1 Tax=Erythroxylum novogranatense TaxID=1862640 RepID=A0AAV8TGQ4_9ROSI|nr:hypothetical protein K2173_020486 [Erythroxylum novogranatense]
MSTHLQLLQDFPQIRLSPLKIDSLPSSSPTLDDDNTATPRQNGASADVCRTPTSEEHRIPSILSCPPAPRKPKRPSISCKRKLSELEFFEIVNREEVESFFRSSFEVVSKRRRGVST